MQCSSSELSTPEANCEYVKKLYLKNSFAYDETDDGSRVRSRTDVNLSLKHLPGLTTWKSCDTMKQSVCR